MKFKPGSLSGCLLQIHCVCLGLNPVAALALACFIGGVLCLAWWLPSLEQTLLSRQAEVDQLVHAAGERKPAPALPPSQSEQRVARFYDNLGENSYAEQQLKTIFEIASRRSLVLNAGEYKSSYEKNSDTFAYQIQLPVTGPYLEIREFCEEVLQTIPFAALDEVSFKRQTISTNNLEAKLQFTLYLTSRKKPLAGA